MKRIKFELDDINFCSVKYDAISRLMEKYTIKMIDIYIDQVILPDGSLHHDIHYRSKHDHLIKLLHNKTIYFVADVLPPTSSILAKKYVDSFFYNGFFLPKGLTIKEYIGYGMGFLIFHKNSRELTNFKLRYE